MIKFDTIVLSDKEPEKSDLWLKILHSDKIGEDGTTDMNISGLKLQYYSPRGWRSLLDWNTNMIYDFGYSKETEGYTGDPITLSVEENKKTENTDVTTNYWVYDGSRDLGDYDNIVLEKGLKTVLEDYVTKEQLQETIADITAEGGTTVTWADADVDSSLSSVEIGTLTINGVAYTIKSYYDTPETEVSAQYSSGVLVATINGAEIYIPEIEDIDISAQYTAGTLIATIDGTEIYIPEVEDIEISAQYTSGVLVATINGTQIYIPETDVEAQYTSGTLLATINGTEIYTPEIEDVEVSAQYNSGTLVATINGTEIYIPKEEDIEISAQYTEGTLVATINGTKIYIPETEVSTQYTSGTLVATINGTEIYIPEDEDLEISTQYTSGTLIATIGGTEIYIPEIEEIEISTEYTSGTLIATINGTEIYAPEVQMPASVVEVDAKYTSGTLLAIINDTEIYTPTWSGSTVVELIASSSSVSVTETSLKGVLQDMTASILGYESVGSAYYAPLDSNTESGLTYYTINVWNGEELAIAAENNSQALVPVSALYNVYKELLDKIEDAESRLDEIEKTSSMAILTYDVEADEEVIITLHGEYFESIIIDGEEIELTDGMITYTWSTAGIQTVYAKLKDGLTSVTQCFGAVDPITLGSTITTGARQLYSVSANLFENCTQVTDFSYCFWYCTSLQYIPVGLFDNCVAATSYKSCFAGCSSLESIPAYLFANCTQVTTYKSCFEYCESLTTISEGIFDNNAQTESADYCFNTCTSLTSVPEGLFDYFTAVDNFERCFYGCTSLESIPEKLFDNCVAATNLDSCFYNCTSLDDAVVYIGSEIVKEVEKFAYNVNNMTVYVIEDSTTYESFEEDSTANVTINTYTK